MSEPNNMYRLGVSYSVWDGEELLEKSIRTIREHCDYINVVWQKKSWFGEPCNENLEAILLELKEKCLIDEIILFEPDKNLEASCNELKKRNLGLEYVKKAQCTHFLIMDADEFYKSEEFAIAKQFIYNYRITHSICNLYTYLTPECREIETSPYFVSFIHKINKNSKLVMNACSPLPWLVDPTRQIPLKFNSTPCVLHQVAMHHFSGVRKDIKKKYRNSSASLNQEQQNNFINYYTSDIQSLIESGKCIHVKNIFNIDI